MTGSGPYSYTQDSLAVIMVLMKIGLLFVESSIFFESWVYGYDPETKCNFGTLENIPYNKNAWRNKTFGE